MSPSQSSATDVVVKTLDLTRSAIDALDKGGVVTKTAGCLIQWLAREGIDKNEFANCLDYIRALTYPNENGLQIQWKLRAADLKISKMPRLAGISLLSPGSIGRWMAFDPDFCYVVTSVAAIMTHHDLPFAANAICQMVLDEGGHEDGIRKTYSIQKARLLPVITKIVESIALNVVNCGDDLGAMPSELSDLCTHVTYSQTFAAVTMAILRSKNDVLLRCTLFMGDIFVWLLAHAEGRIELSIAGAIVFERHFGESKRRIIVLVSEACKQEVEAHSSQGKTIEVSHSVGSTFCKILSDRASTVHLQGPQPTCRQKLYSLDAINRERVDGTLNNAETFKVQVVGQAIIMWMMNRQLEPSGGSDIQFTTNADPASNFTTHVGHLLYRWPQICHWELTSSSAEIAVFRSPRDYEPGNPDSDPNNESRLMSINWLFECFPEVLDLLSLVKRRCACTYCRRGTELTETFRPGCLQEKVTEEIFTLIAHSVADAFGAPDVSYIGGLSNVKQGVQRLLSDLIHGSRVTWEIWFSLAACVYLGCPWSLLRDTPSEGATEPAAVQFGSAVVAAKWLDMTSKIDPNGCFGFEVAQGCLGGIENSFAIVHLERTMSGAFEDRRALHVDSETNNYLQVDKSEHLLQTAIVGATGLPYRLLVMIKSGSSRRVVDPAGVIMCLARSERPHCEHSPSNGRLSITKDSYKTWTFAEVLAYWKVVENHKVDADSQYLTYLTKTLPSYVQLNVVCALSWRGCVIRDERCCIICAEASDVNGKSKRIISVKNEMHAVARLL